MVGLCVSWPLLPRTHALHARMSRLLPPLTLDPNEGLRLHLGPLNLPANFDLRLHSSATSIATNPFSASITKQAS